MCKLKKMVSFALIVSACLFLNNCSKTVVKDGTIYTVGRTVSQEKKFKISLKVYKDPEVDYSLFKKFRLEFKASDQNNPLLNRQLRSLVKENMLKRGFVENIENPDFIVMGSHQNIFVPDRDPGILPRTHGSFSGSVGGQPLSGTYTSGDGLVAAMVKAKMAQRYWIHGFEIIFFDSRTNQVIWAGNANGYVRVDDIRETIPDLINALLDNYPEPRTKE